MYTDLTTLSVGPESSIRQAIGQMDISRIGMVLVVDSERKLLGTISDGDVRRMVLANIDLNQPVSALLAIRDGSLHGRPITAPVEADHSTLLHVLQRHKISHLPLVDQDQRVVALVTLAEFVSEQEQPLQAVIMAGGAGMRLRPLTEEIPKPMLPVGDRPLLEIIVQQLRAAGIKQVSVSVHHKSEKITDYFGNGQGFGIEITYLTEDRPLGTAGALGLMESPQATVLVINGDILTGVDFRLMLEYHRLHRAEITVGVRQYGLQVRYGVIECEGIFVRRLTEKPLLKFFVNAGIYLLEPNVYRFIPSGERFDMTDLIQRLTDAGRPVVAFPIREDWLDIGQPADYEQAQEWK